MRRRFITILLSVIALVGCVGVPPEHKTPGPQLTGYGGNGVPVLLGIPDTFQDTATTEAATDTGASTDTKDAKSSDVCKPLLQDCK